MALGSDHRVNVNEQEYTMNPLLSLLVDMFRAEEDNYLHTITDPAEEAQHLTDLVDFARDALAADDKMGTIEASARAQMAHAHLIIVGRDVDALDFFSRLNSIAPVLPPDVTYTDYCDNIRSANN